MRDQTLVNLGFRGTKAERRVLKQYAHRLEISVQKLLERAVHHYRMTVLDRNGAEHSPDFHREREEFIAYLRAGGREAKLLLAILKVFREK